MHPLSAEEKGNLLFILQKGEKSEEDTIIPWITSQALGSYWDRKVKGDKYYHLIYTFKNSICRCWRKVYTLQINLY